MNDIDKKILSLLQTNADIPIAKLSKKIPAAVICEIMNEDGTMAKGDDLFKFSKEHKLRIGTISDLISYRRKKEKIIPKIVFNYKISFLFFNFYGKLKSSQKFMVYNVFFFKPFINFTYNCNFLIHFF